MAGPCQLLEEQGHPTDPVKGSSGVKLGLYSTPTVRVGGTGGGDRAGLVTSAVSKSVAVAPQPACVADPGGTRHSSPRSGHATSVL